MNYQRSNIELYSLKLYFKGEDLKTARSTPLPLPLSLDFSNNYLFYNFSPCRPPSPLIDPVREKYTNDDKLVEDLKNALAGPELADVMFIVGKRNYILVCVCVCVCVCAAIRICSKYGIALTLSIIPVRKLYHQMCVCI